MAGRARGSERALRCGTERLALGLILLLTTGLVASYERHTTFLGDEWGWLFSALHPSAHTFLAPDNGHLIAFTHAVYDLLPRMVGLSGIWAFRSLSVLLHLTVVLLVWSLSRRRAGPGVALVLAASIALLGTGSDTFLSGINVPDLSGTAASLGALAAFDRDTRRGDLIACVLQMAALAAFTNAVAFAAGILVEIILQGRLRRRGWVVLLPAALYLAWRLHWAGGLLTSTGTGTHTAGGPLEVLRHALQAATGAVAGLAGVQLFSPTLRAHLPWLATAAQVAVAGAGVLLGIALGRRSRPPARGRRGRPPARLANLLGAALVLWLLLALGRGTSGELYASRYVYLGAVLLVLVLAELVPVLRPSRRTLRVLAGIAALSVASNLVWMRVWANHLRDETGVARAQLAALQLAGASVPADYAPPSAFALVDVTAGRLRAAQAIYGGSAGYSRAELLRAPEKAQAAADAVAVHALGVSLVRLSARRLPSAAPAQAPPALRGSRAVSVTARANCLRLRPRHGVGSTDLSPAGGPVLSLVADRGGVLVLARRFADRYTVGLGGLLGTRGAALILLPPGASAVPWRLRLLLSSSATVCSAG